MIRAAAERGLVGVTIPKVWGGAGRDYVSYALAIEAIARASATVAAALSVNNSLVAELIAYAGREQQKEEWLRRLTSGDAHRGVRAFGAERRERCGQSTDDRSEGRRPISDRRPQGLDRER